MLGFSLYISCPSGNLPLIEVSACTKTPILAYLLCKFMLRIFFSIIWNNQTWVSIASSYRDVSWDSILPRKKPWNESTIS
jgi:hypothetical protein